MRRTLVAGNWKMNGARAEACALVAGLTNGLANVAGQGDVVICPPFVLLDVVAAALAASPVQLGAQNVGAELSGAFTGEVSAEMLREAACNFVIVGHSERRALYGEDNELVARKFMRSQAAGLTPILCVGETLEERERDVTQTVIAAQLDAVLDSAGVDALNRAVVAYEPVWAIGTGRTASPEQAQAVHAFIRDRIASASAEVGAAVRIVYGGSVKPDNAAELFAAADIDGGLIGGASLKADDFVAICVAAAA
jgi:triosephosphate isomerase (TIM)